MTRLYQKRPVRSKAHILKPDKGALGIGIKVIPPHGDEPVPPEPCVLQEYIQSYLYRGVKFDFRIYCLVIWESGPLVYVYRDGIARLCSAPSTEQSRFGQLTNTAVNITNPNVTAESITRSVAEVLGDLGQKPEIINRIWNQIDDAVVFTILSGFTRMQADLRAYPALKFDLYPRCFQLLGFDVLLDEDLKPWVLEVNYRPSLDWGTQQEHDLKVKLIEDVLNLALPRREFDEAIDSRNSRNPSSGDTGTQPLGDQALDAALRKAKVEAEKSATQFKKVYPVAGSKNKWADVVQGATRLFFDKVYRGTC
jgi:hypothetical protein